MYQDLNKLGITCVKLLVKADWKEAREIQLSNAFEWVKFSSEDIGYMKVMACDDKTKTDIWSYSFKITNRSRLFVTS